MKIPVANSSGVNLSATTSLPEIPWIPALRRVVRSQIRVSVRNTRLDLLLLTTFYSLFYRIFRVAINALTLVVGIQIRTCVQNSRLDLLQLTEFDNLFYRIFRVAIFLLLLCARDPMEKICISVRRRPREASASTSATHCTLCLQS